MTSFNFNNNSSLSISKPNLKKSKVKFNRWKCSSKRKNSLELSDVGSNIFGSTESVNNGSYLIVLNISKFISSISNSELMY